MAKIDVEMPKMGESITEGTVIVWLKKPGDQVELDEPLLEIGTDKVDTEVPSPAAGKLAEVLVEEGETVEVGTVIARLETGAEDSDDAGDADSADSEGAAEPKSEPTTSGNGQADDKKKEAAPQQASSDSTSAGGGTKPQKSGGAVATMAKGEPVQVVMPKMGESIMEGTIISWAKKPGDAIELDETLLEIATDKVDTEVPSPAAGVVVQLLAEEGATVEVGTPIAIIATGEGVEAGSGDAPSEPADAETDSGEETSTEKASAGEPPQQAPPPAENGQAGPIPRHSEDGSFYTPLVRSIAEKEGVSLQELKSIEGSGRDGRVTKADLMAYLENRGAAPPQPTPSAAPPPKKEVARPAPVVESSGDGRVEIIKMDRMRQIIADHMTRSKSTSAHVTSFAEIDVTNLVTLREAQKEAFQQQEGVKLTYTPFFVHAAVDALKDHPLMNGSVQEKEIVVRKDFHIGIAVALGTTGLVAPVIRYAGQKNIAGLAHAAADLASRARSKQLQPEELQGGTFTVTNVGSLGSIMGTPIINQPQVAILAPGAITKRPVVLEDPNLGDVIAIRHMMYVSLSYDHRIIDGAMAASFLRRYREAMEAFKPGYEL